MTGKADLRIPPPPSGDDEFSVPSPTIDFFSNDPGELVVFDPHEMRIVRLGLVPPIAFLVTCICGDAQRVEWFERTDPDAPLHERITAAYRQHLKDTP